MPRKTNLRDLARRLELSPTTVSEALRGVPRVKEATRDLVRRVAAEMGYEPNRLVGAVMSELRRAGAASYRGTLAVLDLYDANRRSEGANRYHKEVAAGATRRAEQLGFKVDTLGREAGVLSRRRLRGVLDARGVRGVMLLPMAEPDFSDIDVEGLAAIYTDFAARRATLHSVCVDHYGAIMLALEKVREHGYRRPGLVIQDAHDARLLHRWEAGYAMFRSYYARPLGLSCAPACVLPRDPAGGVDAQAFFSWFARARCDVIIAHHAQVRTLMEAAGARVPETHGFCCLNVFNAGHPCAGLDLRPRMLGERAAELLIGQVLRNESGVPERALTTTMPVDWVDGETLRARKE